MWLFIIRQFLILVPREEVKALTGTTKFAATVMLVNECSTVSVFMAISGRDIEEPRCVGILGIPSSIGGQLKANSWHTIV